MSLVHELHELPTIDMTDNETGCCPRFHPKAWDEKTFVLDDMKFAKATAKSFMHMPLNFSKMMTRSQELIEKAGANDPERYLVLSQDDSKWHSSHYFKVMKDVQGMEMATIKGHYMSKVYKGDYKEIPTFINSFERYLDERDLSVDMKDLFIFYTTCPNCAKHYGENYMVFFTKISN